MEFKFSTFTRSRYIQFKNMFYNILVYYVHFLFCRLNYFKYF